RRPIPIRRTLLLNEAVGEGHPEIVPERRRRMDGGGLEGLRHRAAGAGESERSGRSAPGRSARPSPRAAPGRRRVELSAQGDRDRRIGAGRGATAPLVGKYLIRLLPRKFFFSRRSRSGIIKIFH